MPRHEATPEKFRTIEVRQMYALADMATFRVRESRGTESAFLMRRETLGSDTYTNCAWPAP